jgi:hypothetical protein
MASARLPGRESGGEALELRALCGGGPPGLEGGAGAHEHVGGGGEDLVRDLGDDAPRALDGEQGALDPLDDVGHRGEVLEGGDAAQAADALHDAVAVRGVSGAAAHAGHAHGELVGLEGEEGGAEGAHGGGGGGAGDRGQGVELGGAGARLRLLDRAPVTDLVEEHLEVVHRADEGEADGGAPREGVVGEGLGHALEGAGHVGEAGELGHGGRAAQAAGVLEEGVGARARVRAREEGVELLEALARFQHEEVQQTAARCRHRRSERMGGRYGPRIPWVNAAGRRPSPGACRARRWRARLPSPG